MVHKSELESHQHRLNDETDGGCGCMEMLLKMREIHGDDE